MVSGLVNGSSRMSAKSDVYVIYRCLRTLRDSLRQSLYIKLIGVVSLNLTWLEVAKMKISSFLIELISKLSILRYVVLSFNINS